MRRSIPAAISVTRCATSSAPALRRCNVCGCAVKSDGVAAFGVVAIWVLSPSQLRHLLYLCDRLHFLNDDFLRQFRVGQWLTILLPVGHHPLQEVFHRVALS